MAFKINIQHELELEMEALLEKSGLRSKTEYINEAIRNFNRALKRRTELASLQAYFKSYRAEGKDVLSEFHWLRRSKH